MRCLELAEYRGTVREGFEPRGVNKFETSQIIAARLRANVGEPVLTTVPIYPFSAAKCVKMFELEARGVEPLS